MLSFKEFRHLTEAKEKHKAQPSLLPPVLIFKRKAIRALPDGQQISSYYSDQLGKHVIFPITF